MVTTDFGRSNRGTLLMTTDETAIVRPQALEKSQGVTAAEARDEVRRLLDEQFCRVQPAISEDVVLADAVLVASELVTNAIRQGGGVRAFKLSLSEEGLWISVTDGNRTWPNDALPETVSYPADGLSLVRRLSQDVTITPAPGGKTIHALVSLR
jgi:anti-sigma regulatory factor (Ser/Thr protein kinase)